MRAAVFAILLLAGAAPAQSGFLYAASALGRVSANAYPLDKLPADATTNKFAPEMELWRDLFVTGEDRWLIRGDGRISRNGEFVDDLAEDVEWQGIVVVNGDYVALRRDGRVSGPGGILFEYPAGDFEFLDIVTDGQAVYVLRSNGSVFRVPDAEPFIQFDGPPGEIEDKTGDGESPDTEWLYLALNPADGELWGLRRDGTLQHAAIPADPLVPGATEAELPYDDSDADIDIDELYTGLAFDDDGTWYALRADGKVYNVAAQSLPLVDLNGEPSEDDSHAYRAILLHAGESFVLRDDGALFRDFVDEAVVNLQDSRYFLLARGDVLPNLDNVDNKPPTATSTIVTAPEGTDIVLPIVATDRDLPADQLVVDVDPETLPPGASWDGVLRVITWPAAGPAGTYKIKAFVNDGIAKPVKAVQTIKIQTPDDNPDKNIKPALAKVKKATALVGVPFSLKLLAFDRDGDTVTLSLNPDAKPPPAGVTFDGVEWLLEWNSPLIADKGSNAIKFLVQDGTVTLKVERKVKVETSLLGF